MQKVDCKVTVIVAVYNTAKFLGRCLDSICSQTYSNLEIVVVDDCSADESPDIAKWYAQNDNRVKLLSHSRNEGLFLARMTGIKQSSGEYIAFVDSDDYISIDFIRSLVASASSKGADIAVAKTVQEADGIGRYVHTMYHNYDFGDVEEGKVFDKYMEQEGSCFIWHTIWNKLYRRELWDNAMVHLSKINRHLIMTEDFLFSTIIMSGAKSIVSNDYAYYFYYQHSGASTSLVGGAEKFTKNIADLVFVFKEVNTFLLNNGFEAYIAHFKNWRALYARFWVDNIKNSTLTNKQKTDLLLALADGMESDLRGATETDHHFYRITMPWDGRYNDIVERLVKSDCEYFSFDIFDTMVTRPYHEPLDMFKVMNKAFYDLFKRNDDFAKNREVAEVVARKNNSTMQDITMQDIYYELNALFGYDTERLKELASIEEQLEIASCNARRSVKNLYDLLMYLDKKVICISDMYLRQGVIRAILDKCGYNGVQKIYLSGDIGLSKSGRKLFYHVLKDCKIRSDELLHIGDNWESDKLAVEEVGINGIFYPSCKEVFMNYISDIPFSDTANKYNKPTATWLNLTSSLQYFGVRCALAVVYNRLCDNPYASYKEGSSFCASPQFMGGYPLAMHMLGVAKFVHKKSKNYNKIHFIARDGYLPMLAYKELYGGEHSYLHISRKSLFPLMIKDADSFMQLGEYAGWSNSSPRKIINLILPTLNVSSVEDIILPQKVILDKPFKSYEEYIFVIKSIVDSFFSMEKLQQYKRNLKDYFGKIIGKNEVSFDIGYSGRSQVLLSELLGFNFDAIYIHQNATKFKESIARLNIDIASFYDFTPSVTGGVREVVMSSCAPSAIGYGSDNAVIYEKDTVSYTAKHIIAEMQRAVLTYLKDIKETLLSVDGITLDSLDWRNIDISAPFEMFMHHASQYDRDVFAVFSFEDELFAGKKAIKLSEMWGEDIAYHYSGEKFSNNYFNEKYGVNNAKLWKKFLFYWMFDKQGLKTRISNKLNARSNLQA